MKFLVDANVLSEPTKPAFSQKVVDWLDAHESELTTSAQVIGELCRGVDALAEGRKKQQLKSWFMRMRSRMPVLDWTAEAAVAWAELVNDVRSRGYTVGILDTQIAATAKLHGLTVATRNVDDFTRCGVPW
jgi:predicted nucleic acid-binding protein